MKSLLLAVTYIVLGATITHASFITDKELAAVLDAHVKAVQARDLAALEKTITTGETLDLILPNGHRTTTRAQYVDMHREWFKETNWTWSLANVAVAEAKDMAVVTARTRYEERDGDKSVVAEGWLSLTFRREAAGWRLVHDQNTPIRKPSP
jgi:ketosteroid isomerase-like protein